MAEYSFSHLGFLWCICSSIAFWIVFNSDFKQSHLGACLCSGWLAYFHVTEFTLANQFLLLSKSSHFWQVRVSKFRVVGGKFSHLILKDFPQRLRDVLRKPMISPLDFKISKKKLSQAFTHESTHSIYLCFANILLMLIPNIQF